ncbi:hypothetical protein G9A89_011087 [Geosiphon pyriformis]|nr:hypothetical protein G9A89_011087 [Geosiphon pyriformis]
MDVIGSDEFLLVVKKLLDGKVAGLSDILNKLWKHKNAQILSGLLDILNVCLELGTVSLQWRQVWVSMIPKPYDWEETLTNTKPIALVETARKILSKILSNKISLACSKFNVLHGNNFSETVADTSRYVKGLQLSWMASFVEQFMMTDFGLTDRYTVYDGLDQGEVFLLLLWRIFYDSLLCKVKKHEQLCGYRLNSKIFTKTGRADSKSSKTSFFAAVENCLVATQCILDIVNKFFLINDIAINTNKMIAIPINQGAREVSLSISDSKITIPSLAKTHSDVKFFLNMVLRKAITKKQFLYLVSAVLQPIIEYRLQFSCVSKGNFLNEALYHPELYSLRIFEQVLAENLLAGLVKFANANRILGELFKYKAMELQAASWMLQHLLKFLIKLLVNPMNCFLAGITCALKLCNLSLSGDLLDVFQARNSIAVLDVLSFESYLGIAKSLKKYGVVFANQLLDCHGKCFTWNTFHRWKKLDSKGLVSVWFASLVKFIINGDLSNNVLLFLCLVPTGSSCDFGYVGEHLLNSGLGFIIIYTNGSIKNLGLLHVCGSATAYFPDVNTSVGIKMDGLLLSTLVKIQAIALALKCMPTSQLVDLYIDSQASLDLCKSASGMTGPDFYHSGVVGNEHADFYADAAVISKFFLPMVVPYHFFVIEGRPVFENVRHVTKKLFNAVYFVVTGMKLAIPLISPAIQIIRDNLKINSVIRGSTTSRKREFTANKHRQHLRKETKNLWNILLSNTTLEWNVLLGTFANENAVAKLLNKAASSIDLFTTLAKSFVLKNWVVDMLDCLGADFDRGALVVNFIHYFAKSHRSVIWLPTAKPGVTNRLLKLVANQFQNVSCVEEISSRDGSSIPSMSGLSSLWSAETIRNFGFRLGIHVCFGLHPCLTRSDFGFLCDVSVVGNLGV